MITRTLQKYAEYISEKYPVTTITGPRQSGKTTLAKMAFPDLSYSNLEHLPTREYANTDPEGYLSSFSTGVIIDEVQKVPDLLSWIQVKSDENNQNRQYILTGSNQMNIQGTVSQSLAGRTALLKLLPFSIKEVSNYGKTDTDTMIVKGFYPRIHENGIPPFQGYSDYFQTYVERDLRQLVNIRNISLFERFVRLCAGRVGQLLNIASLSNDAGVTESTVKEWLSILEESYILFRLPPFHGNIKKRLIKSPKLYFYDPGLASWLIGIEEEAQIKTHPLRGNLYENMVVSDILKYRYNSGKGNNLTFYRDSTGNEIDLIYQVADRIIPIEIKSSKTLNTSFFNGFEKFFKAAGKPEKALIVYNGDETQTRHGITAVKEEHVTEYLD